jgi:hypothetical protein
MSTGELLTVIAAVTAAIVTVINAIAGGWGRSAAKMQAAADQAESVGKLDQIHQSTNGNLTKVNSQLDTALSRIDKLETILRDVAVANKQVVVQVPGAPTVP